MMTTAANCARKHNSLSSSQAAWDRVVKDLEHEGGMAVVSLPPTSANIHAYAFETAQRAMDDDKSHYDCPIIPPNADSAHVTGYHSTEGMSRYNMHREGLVFSDGNLAGNNEFQHAMRAMFDSLHGIAQHVLTALEEEWQLPENWFQNTLGPTERYSQWHMKRYVLPSTRPSTPTRKNGETDGNDVPAIWLPVHTDPSLISVVIHNVPGQCEGAMGLEYQTSDGEWRQVPQSGHASATIFVGSVLSNITGKQIQACKHRVVYIKNDYITQTRMAATLFVRPRMTARLVVPPSPKFENVTLKKQITFEVWNSRVSKNYMKQKKQESESSVVNEGLE